MQILSPAPEISRRDISDASCDGGRMAKALVCGTSYAGSIPVRHPKSSGSILFSPNKDTLSVMASEVNKDFRVWALGLHGVGRRTCNAKIRSVQFRQGPPFSYNNAHHQQESVLHHDSLHKELLSY